VGRDDQRRSHRSEYTEARARCILGARTNGIDAALNSTDPPLDVLVAPTWAWLYSFAAVAGYPSTSLPVGFYDDGSPIGFCMVGSAWQEQKLLAFNYDLEQELNAQRPPQFLGTVPDEPPEAASAAASPRCTGVPEGPLAEQADPLARDSGQRPGDGAAARVRDVARDDRDARGGVTPLKPVAAREPSRQWV